MYLSNRFFGLSGAVAVLFAIAFLLPWLYYPGWVILTLLVALTLTDVFLLWGGRASVDAQRHLSSRWGIGDTHLIEIQLHNTGKIPLKLTIHDDAPQQLQLRHFSLSANLQAGATTTVSYKVQPNERGRYRFGYLYVFGRTHIGLSERRWLRGSPTEVPAYPSIKQLQQQELHLHSRAASTQGIKKLRRLGNSYEFEQIRPYINGDDYRTINWRATGRAAELRVNQYQDERAQQVYCVIDKSRSMNLTFAGLSLLDYAINSTLSISNIILRNHDNAGLLTFGKELSGIVKADRRPKQLQQILETLYREQISEQEADYSLLFKATRQLIGRRSLIILYTNFESTYALQRVLPVLRHIRQQHLLTVVLFENTDVTDYISQPAQNIAQVYVHLAAHQYINDKQAMTRLLRQYGISAILTRPEQLHLGVINHYLALKAKGAI